MLVLACILTLSCKQKKIDSSSVAYHIVRKKEAISANWFGEKSAYCFLVEILNFGLDSAVEMVILDYNAKS
jgi:hypothetical protein